jgi:meso-butanediol dehydrogenase / (S,S)-butanediol dehydrogenase / diacetyl reductase
MSETEGRIAVVTGAASGLGAALAQQLADAGMTVAALDIDLEGAQRTAATLAERGATSEAFAVDAGDVAAVRDAARRVDARFGGCDLLCANVGVQQFGGIDRLTDDDWTWVIGVNVLGTVRTVSAFLPLLRQRTGWRHVLLTASTSVFSPGTRLGAYVASKCAVAGYGEVLREELAGEGIGVTILFPAGMATRHLESSALARPEALGASIMRPEDIDAMLKSRSMDVAASILPPEDAIRGLLPQLLANEPYFVTHDDFRAEYEQRRAQLERAFDAMEARRAR